MRTISNSFARLGKAFLLLAAAFTANPTAKADCTYDKALTGQEFGVGVMLTWATSTETNNSVFTVERSDNGIDFKQVGTVRGAGNSRKMKSYNFLDAAANGQKIYYRLKQVDNDGKYSYSRIAFVSIFKNVEQSQTVEVSPNPSNGKDVQLMMHNVLSNSMVTYQIKDMMGNEITAPSEKELVSNGTFKQTIATSYLADGIYYIIINIDNKQIVNKLVIKK
ncbi:MAG: hypothetical protein RIS64_4520 [Bacteroidota bacterium]